MSLPLEKDPNLVECLECGATTAKEIDRLTVEGEILVLFHCFLCGGNFTTLLLKLICLGKGNWSVFRIVPPTQ